MTNKELVVEFKNGATKGIASHLYIKDNKLYHYETVIVYRDENGKFYLNDRFYSSTTSRIQDYCKKVLSPLELFRGDDFVKLEYGEKQKRARDIY